MKKLTVFVLLFLVAVFAFSVASQGNAATEKRLLRATFAWPTYIDPAVGKDISGATALQSLYDPLVFPDTNGNPVPHVAKSWEALPDGLTWTFHLRSGIKFHDGSELTAEDVKFSMDRLLTMGEGHSFLFLGRIKETEAVDRYTVKFHMEKPFGPFLSTLFQFYILNKNLVMRHIKKPGSFGDMGDYGREWLLTHDAGSGAYMVKEFPLEEYLLMEKHPDYWGYIDPYAPDEFKMIGTTEPVTVRTLMARRELEISDKWQPPEALAALNRIDGVEIATYYTHDQYYMHIHTRKPPTDDIHVRKAMTWAFDYKAATGLFPGSAETRAPNAQSLPGSDPNLPQFRRDVQKAKEELKKSKYYGQLNKYPVEVHWCAEVPAEEKIALLFMANMDEIGIPVKVVKVPWLTMVEESATQETSPHLFHLINTARYPEAGAQLEARYHSRSAPSFLQNEWLLDEVLDGKIEDALTTDDREKRFAKYAEIQRYILDLYPSIFVLDPAVRQAYQTGYVDWPSARKGGVIPVNGYFIVPRFIRVYPEERAALSK